MTVSLPMYDRPETREATAAFWRAIRSDLAIRAPGLDALPDRLRVPTDAMAHWRDPALIFSQTCGLPFRKHLHPQVVLCGTPDFGLPGCPPGHYNSVLVMRRDDPRGPDDWPVMTLALNGFDSQSGWAAPFAHAQARGVHFCTHHVTGAHRASARAVLDGAADIAALDAQTWRMMRRWDDWTAGLREAEHTEPTPGLPYITAAGRHSGHRPDPAAAFAALAPEHRATLDLRGIVALPEEFYTALPLPPDPAESD